ncbi:MAG: efflux transporter periplasmic adaptor subunit, partial [Verrucomicrobiota bacterium]
MAGCRPEAPAGAPPPPKVSVLSVAEVRVRQAVFAPAVVEGVREVEVRARVTGMLLSVGGRAGARVRAGELSERYD